MDEISQKIGEFQATLVAQRLRIDGLHQENIARHGETATRLVDMQAQLHEIKHASNNERMELARVGQIVAGHQDADKKDHEAVMAAIKGHHEFAVAAENRAQISANALAQRLADVEIKAGTREGERRAEERHGQRGEQWSLTRWVIVVGLVATLLSGVIAGALGPLVTVMLGGRL